MISLPYEIYEGGSTPIVLARPNIADASEVISGDFTCEVSLLGPDGKVIVAARPSTAKTEDELYFAVQLSPAETALVNVVALPVTCTWVVQIENLLLSPNYSKEKHIELIVKKAGI